MDDAPGRHRGTAHPLELPIGRRVLFAVCALLGSGFVFDDTGWRFAVGAGLFGVSMVAFYLAARLITKGYPDLDDGQDQTRVIRGDGSTAASEKARRDSTSARRTPSGKKPREK
ncbi:hypothetical protein [Nocardioides panaciterrulae]|uniref:Uncharacterized protein n=1 Tax=Nocardioides panaciterrulae TaxID=661492 RepID=A0A7Y9E6A3_9ACTN|nr:hypothetical protein [Nocardioides panaciterrulae]NYD41910.1 hypothetical protein [Nocardioides panaciterrulae]